MEPVVHATTAQAANEEFLAGSGEMIALIRAHDWSRTPIGSIAGWPQSLKTAVSICLNSRFPIIVWWGPDLTSVYNDAYRPILGATKHPMALGNTVRAIWPEVWEIVGPMLEGVRATGNATWSDDQLLPMDRNGYLEEAYFTFSYSPIRDEQGHVGGIFTVVTETTMRVIGERRLRILRDLGRLVGAGSAEEACRLAVTVLSENPADVPFALLYLLDDANAEATLAASTGLMADTPLSPRRVELSGEQTPIDQWPLAEVAQSGQPLVLQQIRSRYGALPGGPWPHSPQEALLLPVMTAGRERPAAILVAGVSAGRLLDAEYRSFFDLIVSHTGTCIARAHAYEEERRRAEALAELDRAKTTFFSNVSHEFRTPLTLMLGPMEDALSAEPPALQGENLQIVHRNGLRLLKLVNTLLDFSRIEAGRIQAHYQPTDLAAFTTELASVFRSAVERAGIRLLVDCPALSSPATIDRDMWEKIVLNLVSNAYKFTLEGEIEIRLREQDGQAILTIRDTGTGIAEDQLPHIFERFHRVPGGRARTHEGTGIGLALVQELVRLHGGTVGVDSAVGGGTTFTVRLPLAQTHLSAEGVDGPTTPVAASASVVHDNITHGKAELNIDALNAEAFVEEAARWLPEIRPQGLTSLRRGESRAGRACILLADDNADMRDYVRRLLVPTYDVIAAANGEEALQAVRESAPDLVISDVMMPGLDGFALLRALRSNPDTAAVPVILLSARAGEEARIEGLTAGADDYLIKPFSARELLARIASHLELARVRREAERAIRASEERFRMLADNIAQLVWTTDVEEGRSWYNRRWLEYTGTSVEEMQGWGWQKVHHPDHVRRVTEKISASFLAGTLWEDTFPLRGKDGQYRWFLGRAVPIREENGRVVRWFGTNTDITEQRQMQQELQDERARLQAHQRQIEEMNARLQRAMIETHHRVKNNLQLMSALIDMQRGKGRESVPVTELARLGTNIRALGVIHDILTQEAKAGNDQETLSVKAVLERLIDLLVQTAGGRPLKFEFAEARLLGKQTTAIALITNELVSNALKHGNGEIEVYFRCQGTTATLEVCDDGPGFPTGFNPDTAASTGLELVENIVRWDLRGRVGYDNRVAGGARIFVDFPIP